MGQPIRLDGADYTIAGILPPQLGPFERRQDFFIAAQWSTPRRKGPFFITALGRLRDGVGPAAAASELHAINRRLFPVWKSSYQDDRATWNLMDLKAFVAGDIRTVAGVALAAVALVWLIATANAANLLVARVTSRRRELAVRAALGASRGRVVRYLLAESALLAIGAAAVGLSIAWGGIRLLQTAGANYFPRTQEIGLDGPVLWLLAAVTIASGVLFGAVPALYGAGGPVDESLRSMGRSATGSLAVRRLRRGLVASQFAIATPLLVVAGLLLVSLNELRRVDLGFDTRNMLTGAIQLPAAQYPENASVVFWDELKRRVEALPGVSAVAFADGRPPDECRRLQQLRSRGPAHAGRAVAAGDALGRGHAGVLPRAGPPAPRGTPARRARCARRESRSGRRRSRVGEALLSRTRVPSASGCARAAARSVPGRRSSASSAR